MNRLDKVIAVFDPERALKRVAARSALKKMNQRMGARYEGASKGRRTDGWTAAAGSANAETLFALPTLRERAHDLVRNNPYAEKAVSVMATSLAGTGYTPKLPDNIDGLADLWDNYTDQLDFDGQNKFSGLLTLMARTAFESGEVLVVKRPAPTSKKLAVPFQVQLLEPDFIDDTKNTNDTGSGGWQIQGVEFDASGNRIGYWIFPRHPGDLGKRGDAKLVSTDAISAYYEVKRPGQVHGVPSFSSVILKMRNLDEYDDATIIKAQTEACFAGFIKTESGDINEIVASAKTSTANSPVSRIEPGTLTGLRPGEEVQFAEPGSSGQYEGYCRTTLRAIAAGLRIPYELLTGDFSQVNYSSLRAGLIEFRQYVETLQWNLMVPFCEEIWREFAIRVNAMQLLKGGSQIPLKVKWSPPPFRLVDPLKETLALLMQVRSGFISLPEAIAQQGFDPEEQIREIAAFNKILDENKIILDSDARNVNKAGAMQPEVQATQIIQSGN